MADLRIERPRPKLTYNPGILGDEELARAFVVRHSMLDMILTVIHQNSSSNLSNRHLLLIGPRGIGKTMLVRRAAAAVRSAVLYSSKWYPIVFGEESYPVGSAGEFWLEALFHLADETGDPVLARTMETLRDERDDSQLCERAMNTLSGFAERERKRLLLVVENFNSLVGEQLDSDATEDLRRTLFNNPWVMLLATSTNLFDESAGGPRALFELFEVHEIQPLDADECNALWGSVTGTPLAPSQLKAIRILTGGNPRLVTILAGFAANHSFRQLMEQLVHLIDDHTEYFRGHLDNLGAKERRVFVALLELWDPVGAAAIARQTRLNVNEVSVLLGRLIDRGAVEVAHEGRRKRLYQAAERLYNIYYLMRRRGHPEGRVQAAVQFMITFYEREELVTRLADLAREACDLPEESRKDHYCAYEAVLRKMQVIIPRVIDGTPAEFFQGNDAKLARELGASGLADEAHTLFHDQRLKDSEKLYRRALELDPRNVHAWSGLGGVLFADSRFDEAEVAARRAIDLAPDHNLWKNLGAVQARQGNWAEAEKALMEATRLDASKAESWARLGSIRIALKKFSESEQAYRTAVQLSPNEWAYWNNLAGMSWAAGRPAEAAAAYRKAIELEPGNPSPWQGLGHLLIEIGPPNEAEKVWSDALELHGDTMAACAVHLLDLRLERGVEHDLLLRDAANWISRSKESPTVLEVMAKFIVRWRLSEALPQAESWAREAFAKEPDADSSEAISLVLAERGKWQEALDHVRILLDSSGDGNQWREVATAILIRCAAAGWAKEALEVLKSSAAAAALEPLVVGLEIYLGGSPIIAKEILEVGRDVADRIGKLAEVSPSTGD